MGAILTYGLIAIGILSIAILVFYLIFGRLIRDYLEKNQGWILAGYLITIGISFYLARFLSLTFCFGVRFNCLCNILSYFIVIVSFCAIYYRLFVYKKKDL